MGTALSARRPELSRRRAGPSPERARERAWLGESEKKGHVGCRRGRTGKMFNRQVLAHVVHKLSIRRVLFAQAALNRALAHGQFGGNIREWWHSALEACAQERQDTPADAAARGKCLQPADGVTFEHFEQG